MDDGHVDGNVSQRYCTEFIDSDINTAAASGDDDDGKFVTKRTS